MASHQLAATIPDMSNVGNTCDPADITSADPIPPVCWLSSRGTGSRWVRSRATSTGSSNAALEKDADSVS